MQKTLQTNDQRSNIKQQINQYNVSRVTRSQQPLNILCNNLQNFIQDIGSGWADKSVL